MYLKKVKITTSSILSTENMSAYVVTYLFLATDGGTFCAKRLVLFVLLLYCHSLWEKKDNSSVSNHNSETAYCNTIHCVYETYKSLK